MNDMQDLGTVSLHTLLYLTNMLYLTLLYALPHSPMALPHSTMALPHSTMALPHSTMLYHTLPPHSTWLYLTPPCSTIRYNIIYAQPTTLYHALPHSIMPCLTLPCSYHALPHSTMLIPCSTSLYHAHTMLYLTLPCSYHALPHYILCPTSLYHAHTMLYLTIYYALPHSTMIE